MASPHSPPPVQPRRCARIQVRPGALSWCSAQLHAMTIFGLLPSSATAAGGGAVLRFSMRVATRFASACRIHAFATRSARSVPAVASSEAYQVSIAPVVVSASPGNPPSIL
jgi:hypothetical protein